MGSMGVAITQFGIFFRMKSRRFIERSVLWRRKELILPGKFLERFKRFSKGQRFPKEKKRLKSHLNVGQKLFLVKFQD